jgi:two-component system sensor histidine kinase/response regulator
MTPIKFLIVDDRSENLIALEALLRRDGLEVLQARSGAEALELLLVHDVALALLDVQMPGMDGFELAELMRGTERTRHVPIILITAGTRDPQRHFKGYERGAVDFLYKPIEPLLLKSKTDVFFELARQRATLADLLRVNEMFIAILGHDLRTPLGAMMSGAELLQMRSGGDEATQRVTTRMLSAGNRMKEMIDQLLDLTRARLGQGLQGEKARVDVGALVTRTVDELRSTHPAQPIVVEACGVREAVGDETRLLQLFANLIGNAIQHGTPGRPVEVEINGGRERLEVSISNDGVIAPEVRATMFDPFRARSGARKGLGLGLFIAQEVAHAHGGHIDVRSHDGETTFVVTLPAAS